MGYTRGIGIAGLLLGIVLALVITKAISDTIQSYFIMGLTVGGVSTLLVLATFIGTRERLAHKVQPEPMKFKTWQSIKIIFVDKPFLYVLGGHLLGHTAGGITSTLLVYFAIHSLKISESDILFALPVYMLSAILSISFVWVKLSRKYDKRIALVTALVLSGLCCGLFMIVPEGSMLPILGIMFIAGFGYGGLLLLPYSMLMEVIDKNEIATMERWEGLYYGIWDFIRKLGMNIAKFLPMMALTWMGYVSAVDGQSVSQPEHVVNGIRYLFSLGPALLYLIGALIVSKFPISRAEHEQIRMQLDQRKVSA